MLESEEIKAGDVAAFEGRLVQIMMVLPGGRVLVRGDGLEIAPIGYGRRRGRPSQR